MKMAQHHLYFVLFVACTWLHELTIAMQVQKREVSGDQCSCQGRQTNSVGCGSCVVCFKPGPGGSDGPCVPDTDEECKWEAAYVKSLCLNNDPDQGLDPATGALSPGSVAGIIIGLLALVVAVMILVFVVWTRPHLFGRYFAIRQPPAQNTRPRAQSAVEHQSDSDTSSTVNFAGSAQEREVPSPATIHSRTPAEKQKASICNHGHGHEPLLESHSTSLPSGAFNVNAGDRPSLLPSSVYSDSANITGRADPASMPSNTHNVQSENAPPTPVSDVGLYSNSGSVGSEYNNVQNVDAPPTPSVSSVGDSPFPSTAHQAATQPHNGIQETRLSDNPAHQRASNHGRAGHAHSSGYGTGASSSTPGSRATATPTSPLYIVVERVIVLPPQVPAEVVVPQAQEKYPTQVSDAGISGKDATPQKSTFLGGLIPGSETRYVTAFGAEQAERICGNGGGQVGSFPPQPSQLAGVHPSSTVQDGLTSSTAGSDQPQALVMKETNKQAMLNNSQFGGRAPRTAEGMLKEAKHTTVCKKTYDTPMAKCYPQDVNVVFSSERQVQLLGETIPPKKKPKEETACKSTNGASENT